MAALSQVIATTHRWIRPRIVDNFFTATPLLERMRVRGGSYTKKDGGRKIVEPIIKAAPNGGAYVGLESFTAADNGEATAAEYDWRSYRRVPAISGMDKFQNGGPEGAIDLWTVKTKTAGMGINEDVTAAMYADPTTADVSRDILPLEQIIDDGNTYSIGGLTSDDVGLWQGQASFGGGGVALTLLMVEQQYMLGSQGNIQPTDIVFSQAGYGKLWSLIQVNQRYIGKDNRVGFMNFYFNNAVVQFDSHILVTGGNYTGQRAYFLNLDFLDLVVGEGDGDFAFEDKTPVDADGYVAQIKLYCSLTCNARRFQGALDNFLTT